MPRGTRRLPRECLRRLEQADLILHGGDFTSLAVLEELGRLAPVEGVSGNMDEPGVRELVPPRRVVDVEGARIGMVHDAGPTLGRHERLISAFPGCAAVVYGHTHIPEATEVGETWIVNPGSPTERRSAPHHAMAVLEIDGASLRPLLVRL